MAGALQARSEAEAHGHDASAGPRGPRPGRAAVWPACGATPVTCAVTWTKR